MVEVTLPGVKRVEDVDYDTTTLKVPFTTAVNVAGEVRMVLPGGLVINTARRYDGKWSKSKKRLTLTLQVNPQSQPPLVADKEQARRLCELLAEAQVRAAAANHFTRLVCVLTFPSCSG
eukprot:jgi/Chrzof1/9300/UNPLg00268.t1